MDERPARGLISRTLATATALGLLAAACGGGTTATPSATQTGAGAAQATAQPSAFPAPEKTSIKIGISALEANTFISKFAADLDLYKKYGITSVEVATFEGAQRTLQAVVANQIDVASDAPQSTLISMTTEEPLQDVAVYASGFLDCIVTKNTVKSADDLKGKRVAVSSLGGQSHAEVIVALKALKLQMNDVTIVQVGGQSARVAALQAGSVDAVPADCVVSDGLKDKGFNILLRLPDVAIDFPTSNLSLKRSFIEKNPNTVLAIVAANLEAMQVMFTDEAKAIDSFAAWAQVKKEDAASAIKEFKKIAKRTMRPTTDGYETVKTILVTVNQKVATVDAPKGYTTQFLDQLEKMGVNQRLGVPAK